MRSAAITAGCLAVTMCAMAGCTVRNSKNSDGGDSVRVATPFGGMHVNASDNVPADIGLPVYPGAVSTKSQKDNDNNADLGFQFGSFRLKIQVASYETPDAPDRVFAFYRKAMAKYGDVLECRDGKAVGTPARTASGLTCSDSEKASGSDGHFDVNSSEKGGHELRVGQPHHFRVMGVDKDKSSAGHTKFALVYLELPHGDSDTD